MSDDRFLWSRRTYPEIASAIASGKLVALLPVGAIEAHGPHLSLDADVAIAEAVALRASRVLEADGFAPLVLPALAYSVTGFASEFPGTIGIGPLAAKLLYDDLFTRLALAGVRRLGIVNHHLEPAHRAALHDAIVAAPKRLSIAFPDHTRKPFALALGDEFRSGDCHAGRYETSLLLAIDPARVREERRAALEPRAVGLVAGMKAGKTSFGAIGMTEAYCGDPGAATADEGERLLAALAGIFVASLKEAVAHVE